MRRRLYLDLLPDVSPLAVVGFVIIPFFIMTASWRNLGDYSDMHVRLPDAVEWNVCSLMDEPVYIVFLDKTQRLYVLGESANNKQQLLPMKSFQEFQHTIDSLKRRDEPYHRPNFIIHADKDTKMPVIQRLFDCFLANGIQKFTLAVDANSPKYEEYWKFRKAQYPHQQ
jgi:biopolymer transport protein ExbD